VCAYQPCNRHAWFRISNVICCLHFFIIKTYRRQISQNEITIVGVWYEIFSKFGLFLPAWHLTLSDSRDVISRANFRRSVQLIRVIVSPAVGSAWRTALSHSSCVISSDLIDLDLAFLSDVTYAGLTFLIVKLRVCSHKCQTSTLGTKTTSISVRSDKILQNVCNSDDTLAGFLAPVSSACFWR